MKTGKGGNLGQLWRRNAVVVAIALFVCVAVYLNSKYDQETGKRLGEATMVGNQTEDPLVTGQGQTDVGTQDGMQPTLVQEPDASPYFASARLNRQQARDTARALLQEAASGEGADQTIKDNVTEAIQTMADCAVTEAQIENLVVAKGYADCVAFIKDNQLSLAVSAPSGGMTEADTARIVDAVQQVSDFQIADISIVPVG